MTGRPPLETGAFQVRRACLSPPTATTSNGTVGTVTGITGSLVFDAGPIPAAFTAVTRKR